MKGKVLEVQPDRDGESRGRRLARSQRRRRGTRVAPGVSPGYRKRKRASAEGATPGRFERLTT